jgi:Zn-finger nucleic acid-binding protein
VWLDRGELDKLLERDAASSRRSEDRRDFDDDDDRCPRRRRSLWTELFD